jgi:cytochrome c553
MRGRMLITLVVVAAAARCAASPAPRTAAAPPGAPAAQEASTPAEPGGRAAFDDRVKPILARTCAPCHNPGGKMYERLPFDDPETVASHAEGILRRLKEPADRGPVEEWVRARTDGTRSSQ